jgi:hypothetical protein
MVELLRGLLGEVFRPDDGDPPIALVEAFDASDFAVSSSSIRVSADLLPDHFERVELPAGQPYYDAAMSYFHDHKPTRVMLFAPLLVATSTSRAARPSRLTTAETLTLAALEALPASAQLMSIVPPSFLSAPSKAHHRAAMFQHCDPALIVTHEHEWTSALPGTHTSIRLATLVACVGKQDRPVLRCFRVPDIAQGEHQPIVADLQKLMQQGGGTTDHGYVLRELPSPDDMLAYDAHHPDMAKRTKSLEAFGSVQPLSDLAEVKLGRIDLAREQGRLVPIQRGLVQDGSAVVVEGKNVKPDSESLATSASHGIDANEDELLRTDDLCVATVYSQRAEGLRVQQVGTDDPPLAAARSAIVVRPMPDVTDADQDFLLDYLRSPLVMDYLRAHGMGISLNAHLLANLPAPVMDDALRVVWRDLSGIAIQFSEWARQATEYRDSLFQPTDTENIRLRILNTGRIAGMRHDAATRATEFRYRARTLYPHPVAYRWRIVEAGDGSLDAYQQILESTETLTCYLACMALVALRDVEGVDIGYVDTMAEKLTEKGHGTSFGDWATILEHANRSKAIAKVERLLPFYEVFHVLDDATGEALQRLRERRNDFAHNRGPKGESEVSEACEEALSDLEALMKSAEFLAEYPLRYVESTRWDSIQKVTHYSYRELMGDHPITPQDEATTDEQGIEAGSLYLVDRGGVLRLVRPYLTSLECTKCGCREAFFLDTYTKQTGTCTLKSLERGDTSTHDEIAGAFRSVGLLTG